MSREYFTVVCRGGGGGGGGVKAGKQGICLVYRNECAQVEQGINSKYPMVVVNCVVMWRCLMMGMRPWVCANPSSADITTSSTGAPWQHSVRGVPERRMKLLQPDSRAVQGK